MIKLPLLALLLLVLHPAEPSPAAERARERSKDGERFEQLCNGKTCAAGEATRTFGPSRQQPRGSNDSRSSTQGKYLPHLDQWDSHDFELRLDYRITPNNSTGFANSGIQYRSRELTNNPTPSSLPVTRPTSKRATNIPASSTKNVAAESWPRVDR